MPAAASIARDVQLVKVRSRHNPAGPEIDESHWVAAGRNRKGAPRYAAVDCLKELPGADKGTSRLGGDHQPAALSVNEVEAGAEWLVDFDLARLSGYSTVCRSEDPDALRAEATDGTRPPVSGVEEMRGAELDRGFRGPWGDVAPMRAPIAGHEQLFRAQDPPGIRVEEVHRSNGFRFGRNSL
jgi:hypothetical protein